MAQEDEGDSTEVNHHFIKAALPHLVPLLLEQLTKQVRHLGVERLYGTGPRCAGAALPGSCEGGSWLGNLNAAPGRSSGSWRSHCGAPRVVLRLRAHAPRGPQEEGQDEDDGAWNLSLAAGTCLGLSAAVVGDAIVPLVMPYVQVRPASCVAGWLVLPCTCCLMHCRHTRHRPCWRG